MNIPDITERESRHIEAILDYEENRRRGIRWATYRRNIMKRRKERPPQYSKFGDWYYEDA